MYIYREKKIDMASYDQRNHAAYVFPGKKTLKNDLKLFFYNCLVEFRAVYRYFYLSLSIDIYRSSCD